MNFGNDLFFLDLIALDSRVLSKLSRDPHAEDDVMATSIGERIRTAKEGAREGA